MTIIPEQYVRQTVSKLLINVELLIAIFVSSLTQQCGVDVHKSHGCVYFSRPDICDCDCPSRTARRSLARRTTCDASTRCTPSHNATTPAIENFTIIGREYMTLTTQMAGTRPSRNMGVK